MKSMNIAMAGAAFASLLLLCLPAFSAVDEESEVGRLPSSSWSSPNYLVLCYHDVPIRLSEDKYGVDVFSFIAQLEYMRDAGCSFIGLDDVENAVKGVKPLPDKAVLLTFDDAYESFYRNVFPLLKVYGARAILAVVPRWVDEVPSETEYRKGIMSKAQLKEVSDSGLVEIAGHSFNSHTDIQINPQGGTGPALSNRAYDAKAGSYESEDAYAARVRKDLEKCSQELSTVTGKTPRALMWPYGRYSGVSIREALATGYRYIFTLDDGLASASSSTKIPRHMLEENPSILQFVEGFKKLFDNPLKERTVQLSLDLLYDQDPAAMAKKLDAFLDRMVLLRPSSVLLQGFSGGPSSEPLKEVYFPNGAVAMKADLLSRVSRCLMIRGIQVYVCMPLLRLEGVDGLPIDPLTPEGAAKLERLYGDLASVSMLDGVVFQDDGFLSASADEAREDALNALAGKLRDAVLKFRPAAVFGRTLYASSADDEASKDAFAKLYAKRLAAYDFVVMLCCPAREGLWFKERWLRSFVGGLAKSDPKGVKRTIFELQAYDWGKGEWIDPESLVSWIRVAIAAGAMSAGYFPDDFQAAQPELKRVRTIVSAEDFPFNK